MSRNGTGTYTLPTGNPVVSGTIIEASWANNTLSDIASALTDSLSRSGQGGMSAALRIIDGTVSVPGVAFGNETGSGAYRAAAGDWGLTVLGSRIARLRATGIDVTGNLGVAGDTVTIESSTAYYPQILNRNKTADANGSYFSLQKIRGSSIVQNGDTLGNVIFSGYDGAAYLQGAYINAQVSATPGTNDMPTDLVFGTTPDGSAGPTERFRITSGGDAFIRGGKGLAWYDSSNTGYWAQYNSSGNLLFSNGTERMRLDSSGRLGIGKTPASPFLLDVNGQASIGGDLDVAGAVFRKQASGSGYLVYGTNGSTNNGVYYDQANSAVSLWTVSSQRLTVDSSGNVGIGTSSPFTKLHVTGASQLVRLQNDNAYIQFANTAGTDSAYIQQSSSQFNIISQVNGPMVLGTNGSERMRIDSSGNLLFNSGYGSVATAYGCRAWCNLNGTGTVAIRGSGGISSVTDMGTGYYRFNFSFTMPDTNYADFGGGGKWSDGDNSNGYTQVPYTIQSLRTTTYGVIITRDASAGQVTDPSYVSYSAFR